MSGSGVGGAGVGGAGVGGAGVGVVILGLYHLPSLLTSYLDLSILPIKGGGTEVQSPLLSGCSNIREFHFILHKYQ